MFQLVWKKYLASLQQRPLMTKSMTAATLSATSDSIAQYIEHRSNPVVETNSTFRDHYQLDRSLRLSAYAALLSAPLSHHWYRLLDRRLGSVQTLKSAVTKTVVDQTMVAVPFTCLFFGVNTLLEGRSVDEARSHIERNLWPTMQVNGLVWPAAMLFNFRFVSPDLRVLFGNAVGLGWGVFMSLQQHSRPPQVKEKVKVEAESHLTLKEQEKPRLQMVIQRFVSKQ